MLLPLVALLRGHGRESRIPDLLDDETLVLLVREGLAAAAQRRSMSARTFRRRISQTGTTTSEVVRQNRRMLSILLLRRESPMRDVSASLGYRSERCFLRFVRREFGASPTELRKRLLRTNESSEFDDSVIRLAPDVH